MTSIFPPKLRGVLHLIVKSKSLPVEVSNSTIEFHLPVDSQYSSLVEALHLIVESKSLPVDVNNSTIELHLPVEAKEKLPIILFYTFTPTPKQNKQTNNFIHSCTYMYK